MRAVVMRVFGPPNALEVAAVPDPEPGPGEVVIDVEYASVTFVETQVRDGHPPNPRVLPAVPSTLGIGVVSAVPATGAEDDAALLARRVVASLSGTGGYAERAVVAAGRLIDVPDGLPLRDATALLADGRTAVGLVRRA